MMVPRAYRYSSQAPPMPSKKRDEKEVMAVPVAERISPKTPKREKTTNLTMPPKIFTPPPATPSKPVVIPTKSRNGGRRRSRESMSKDGRKSQAAETPHDESSTPSSGAALLAMTSLTQSAKRFHPDHRRASTPLANRTQGARHRETPRRAISSSSPQSWGVLLSPPEDSEQETGSFESDTTLGPLSSARSISTESMPSLDTDTESLSSVSNPATPGMANSRSGADRRQKSLSTSRGEDCVMDHPLLPETPKAIEEEDEEPLEVSSPPPSAAAKARLAFKSNLTASFRKIRSAAQSFSAFTAPPTQREDYLARSLLGISPQFTDERRPLPSTEPPDPALRRYLNPITLSPSEFHFHPDQESSQAMRPNCTASIQLQAYKRPTRGSKKASSPPVFTSAEQKAFDAVDDLPQASLPRQREPRENSDFLRVIVLEMNMRKVGKLKDGSPGRARLWLPARQEGKMVEDESADGGKGIPKRWTGIRA
ncbi:hypothetical protein ABVK25_006655 [Lepraria finkii]|uniref:Uncharacterized protein n=1 Tax=Lepraria finkii TaxID=1340010 RepID=A0ABR4BAZ9_9LECA